MIDRLTIVGVGLIGGSLGMALREKGYVKEIVGVGRTRENLVIAKERGIIDRFTHEPFRGGVAGADVVFLAVPVEHIPRIAAEIQPALKPGAIVTDGGSTKRLIAAAADKYYRLPGGADAKPEAGPAFVPAHPIAGTEKSGAGAAFPELFEGKRTVLTPTAETPKWAVERVSEMWTVAGAKVEIMDAAQHDSIFGAVSHLPHAAAFALVNAVLQLEQQLHEPLLKYAAGGFRDFTRIASSDPAMWRDIFIQNADEVVRGLGVLEREIQALRKLIETGSGEALRAYATKAKAARDDLLRS